MCHTVIWQIFNELFCDRHCCTPELAVHMVPSLLGMSCILPYGGPPRVQAIADLFGGFKSPNRASCRNKCPEKNVLDEWMNELSKHWWIDQFYNTNFEIFLLKFHPQRVFAVEITSKLSMDCSSFYYWENLVTLCLAFPQCKLSLNKQNNGMCTLFIKGLILRQINLKGTAPAWVSAPSLILIVINEMRHIFFCILPENILSLCFIPQC